MTDLNLQLLNADPPRGAVKRNGKGKKYLPIGDVKEVMRQAFGLRYSDATQLHAFDATNTVDQRTGEIVPGRWDAFAIAQVVVTIGLGSGVCARSGLGVCDAQNATSKGAALDVAVKGAESDAFKRATFGLGKRLGLGLRLDVSVDYETAAEAPAPSCKSGPALEQATAPKALPSYAEALERAERRGLDHALLEELGDWPAADPLPRPHLIELHKGAVRAAGADRVAAVWHLCGVELKKGTQVNGETARLFVQQLAAAAA